MTTTLLVNIDVDDLHKAHRLLLQGVRPGGRPALRRGCGRAARRDLAASICWSKPNGTVASATSRHLRSYARHWTPVHLDFVVDEIDGAVDRARNAGARLEGPVKTNNWGKIAMLADPFGHGICLIEFVGRGYDEIATEKPKVRTRAADAQ